MIRSIIFGTFFLLVLAAPVFATTNVTISENGDNSTSDVSVKSSQTGSSTTCINGKCTTTEGKSNSTVCVNGECYTSEDGNIDVQSEDGKTTVTINNSETVSSDSSKPSITPKEKVKKFFHKKVTREEAKEKMKEMYEKEHNWVEFVGSHALEMVKKLFLFSIF